MFHETYIHLLQPMMAVQNMYAVCVLDVFTLTNVDFKSKGQTFKINKSHIKTANFLINNNH